MHYEKTDCKVRSQMQKEKAKFRRQKVEGKRQKAKAGSKGRRR